MRRAAIWSVRLALIAVMPLVVVAYIALLIRVFSAVVE